MTLTLWIISTDFHFLQNLNKFKLDFDPTCCSPPAVAAPRVSSVWPPQLPAPPWSASRWENFAWWSTQSVALRCSAILQKLNFFLFSHKLKLNFFAMNFSVLISLAIRSSSRRKILNFFFLPKISTRHFLLRNKRFYTASYSFWVVFTYKIL